MVSDGLGQERPFARKSESEADERQRLRSKS